MKCPRTHKIALPSLRPSLARLKPTKLALCHIPAELLSQAPLPGFYPGLPSTTFSLFFSVSSSFVLLHCYVSTSVLHASQCQSVRQSVTLPLESTPPTQQCHPSSLSHYSHQKKAKKKKHSAAMSVDSLRTQHWISALVKKTKTCLLGKKNSHVYWREGGAMDPMSLICR